VIVFGMSVVGVTAVGGTVFGMSAVDVTATTVVSPMAASCRRRASTSKARIAPGAKPQRMAANSKTSVNQQWKL